MRLSLGKQNLQVKVVYWTVCEKRSRWGKKQILCILDKSLCFGFEVHFVTCLTKCLRFPLVVSVLLRSFFSNAFFAITDVCTQVNREFKITTTATTTKTSLKKWISVLLSLLQLITFLNTNELFLSRIPKNHIQVQKEKENLAVACLRPP